MGETRAEAITRHERELLLSRRRRHFQTLTDRELSGAVNNVALSPQRLSPIDRQALLITAASRLWRANGEATAKEDDEA